MVSLTIVVDLITTDTHVKRRYFVQIKAKKVKDIREEMYQNKKWLYKFFGIVFLHEIFHSQKAVVSDI